MKYMLLIYGNESAILSAGKAETEQRMAAYGAYVEAMKKAGVLLGADRLRPTSSASTVRVVDGKTKVLDGPYAETKEQIGGILILEARDMKHAIELMSKHPGVKAGPFEIRPAADLSAMIEESEKRRGTLGK